MITLTKFLENDLKTLWQAQLQGFTKRQMMDLMGYDEKTFNEAYHQSRLQFTEIIKAPRQKPIVLQLKHTPQPVEIFTKKPFKRPKHENSVRSPYGIARPGIIKK